MVIRIQRSKSTGKTTVRSVPPQTVDSPEPFVVGSEPVVTFTKSASQLFVDGKIDLSQPAEGLPEAVENLPPLRSLGDVRQGIAENPASINGKTNAKYGNRYMVGEGVFALKPSEVKRLRLTAKESALLHDYHDLCDLDRYSIASKPSLVLIYATRSSCPDIDKFPRLRAHLERFKPIMSARRETKKGANSWWHLHWPREERIWQSAKILSVQMGKRPAFVPAMSPVYVSFSVNVFVPFDTTKEHLFYLTGLLNSRLLWKWYEHHAKRRGAGLEINGHVLARTPIRRIDFSNKADKARHDKMVELVTRMMELKKQQARAPKKQSPSAKQLLDQRLAITDQQIDALVYELYGLTEDETRIVEGK
jgi:hypothetical protein